MHDLEISQGSATLSLINEGFEVNSISVKFADQNNKFESIEGISGRHHQGSYHEATTVDVEVAFNCLYELDLPLYRDKLVSLVSSVEPFYIREKRAKDKKIVAELPGETSGALQYETAYADGKRYYVLRTTVSEPSFVSGVRYTMAISFETAKLPYAESVGTTKDIDAKGLTFEDGLWSYGMGLSRDTTTWKYTYRNTPTFTIYNAGDVKIDNLSMYRVIKITLAQSTNRIKLYDESGDYFLIERVFQSGDIITIDGHRIKVNGLSALNSTNKTFPVIYTGLNTFKLEGATAFTIEFDFRFYYGSKDVSRIDANQAPVVSTEDKTAPNPPVVQDVYKVSNAISGSAEEGSTVKVTFANGDTATTITSLNGVFNINVPSTVTLTTGQTFSVTATDKSNNTSSPTVVTVKANLYAAPTISPFYIEDGYLIVNNAVISKGLRYDISGSKTSSGWVTATTTSVSFNLKGENLKVGDRISVYITDATTGQKLSDAATITVGTKTVTVMNLWRSSTKDMSNSANPTGNIQVTEVFKVYGNMSQPVHIKTEEDSVIVNGSGDEVRFYELGGLKPNTTYTLSYDISWTETAPGLHTHAWGVGLLYQVSNGSRQHFSFTTNDFGRYGYGNGASMDAPASNILNYMHNSTTSNVVTYSKITLNEGSIDLGYSAGIPTGA